MERWKKAIILILLLVAVYVVLIGPMLNHQDQSVPSLEQIGKVNNTTNNTTVISGSPVAHQRDGTTVYAPIIITDTTNNNIYHRDDSRSTGTGYTTGQRGTDYSSVPPPSGERTPITAEDATREVTPITASQAAEEETPITALQAATEETPVTAAAAVDGADKSGNPPSEQVVADTAEKTGLGALLGEVFGGSGQSGESVPEASESAVPEAGSEVNEPAEGSNIWDNIGEAVSSAGDEASNIASEIGESAGEIGDSMGDIEGGDIGGGDSGGDSGGE